MTYMPPLPQQEQMDRESFRTLLAQETVSFQKIITGSLQAGNELSSANYVAGTSGWQIDGDGNAEFNDVVIRGDILSSNWDGSDPVNLASVDTGATVGFALDSSAGAAQFQEIFVGGEDGYMTLESNEAASAIRWKHNEMTTAGYIEAGHINLGGGDIGYILISPPYDTSSSGDPGLYIAASAGGDSGDSLTYAGDRVSLGPNTDLFMDLGRFYINDNSASRSTTTARHIMDDSGFAWHARSGSTPLFVQRTTSAGDIIDFTYQTTKAGMIQVTSTPSVRYFVDPESYVGLGDGQSLRNQNADGYIDVGPQNTSFGHIYTDRARFAFNKSLAAIGVGFQHTSLPTFNNTNGSMRWMGTSTDMGQAHTSSSLAYKNKVEEVDLEKSVFMRMHPIWFRYQDDHPFRDRWKGVRGVKIGENEDGTPIIEDIEVDYWEGFENAPTGRFGFAFEEVDANPETTHWAYEVEGMEAVSYEGMLPDFIGFGVAAIQQLTTRIKRLEALPVVAAQLKKEVN